MKDVIHKLGFRVVYIAGFVIGWMFESIADVQKLSHKLYRKDRKDFMRTGLWSWSRHPNYFGEIVIWASVWMYCQAGMSNQEHWIAFLLSPFLTFILLVFLSGMKQSERPTAKEQFKLGNSAVYQVYIDSTSPLIPVYPPMWKLLPRFVKLLIFEYPMWSFIPTGDDERALMEHSE